MVVMVFPFGTVEGVEEKCIAREAQGELQRAAVSPVSRERNVLYAQGGWTHCGTNLRRAAMAVVVVVCTFSSKKRGVF
jgi:hypothetical protein